MSSTTAGVMIADALAEIGILGDGEAPSGDMLDRGLRMLNRLLAVLSNDTNWAYYASQEQQVLTGQSSFSVGPTGDLITVRPIAIETATVDVNGITYPVKVIDNERYDVLTYKALSGAYTSAIYYEGTFPNGTVYLYPICTGATLKMRVLNSVKQFADVSTQVEMPDGYEDTMMLALAVRMAPSYGRPVSPDTRLAATKAMKAITTTNITIPTLSLPDAVMGKSGGSYAEFMSGG
jgi:hypothetical protein